ncbi:cell division protein DivIC [Evansella caseinilytica]|uniref:Cell division protein DivIC n=1 Tax=Evansella caseinilytica TaxID=1503961 RepID=A0A1H3UV73_9BACI|nr:septum formation initiator family protein [Evansella caseinilytica]SDZ66350.1 cell division protein DivIC [Evansella caseinilytica]
MRNKPNSNKVRRLTTEYMDKQAYLHEQRQRRRKGLIRRLLVFSCVIIIFAVFIVTTLVNQQATIQEQKQVSEELENDLLSLQKKEEMLKEEIELLQDMEYIAEIARRDFFLTFPGETLFQIPRSSTYSD